MPKQILVTFLQNLLFCVQFLLFILFHQYQEKILGGFFWIFSFQLFKEDNMIPILGQEGEEKRGRVKEEKKTCEVQMFDVKEIGREGICVSLL